MKYECIPFFWCDSHLQEGFFEISSHRHGVKCPPTNRSKAYSASGNQCLDIPLAYLYVALWNYFSEGGGVDYNIRSGHIIRTYLNIKKGSLSKIKTLW